MLIIIGCYDEYGYRVESADGKREFYSAGNHALDSQMGCPAGSPFALSLRKIRSYCIQTTREICEEHNAQFGGVERTH